MTRNAKRFLKRLMALGYSRNDAHRLRAYTDAGFFTYDYIYSIAKHSAKLANTPTVEAVTDIGDITERNLFNIIDQDTKQLTFNEIDSDAKPLFLIQPQLFTGLKNAVMLIKPLLLHDQEKKTT